MTPTTGHRATVKQNINVNHDSTALTSHLLVIDSILHLLIVETCLLHMSNQCDDRVTQEIQLHTAKSTINSKEYHNRSATRNISQSIPGRLSSILKAFSILLKKPPTARPKNGPTKKSVSFISNIDSTSYLDCTQVSTSRCARIIAPLILNWLLWIVCQDTLNAN